MPIYEFVCSACENLFEELVRNRSEEVKCPTCGSAELQRAMSTFAYSTGASSPAAASASSASSGCGGCAKTSCAGCSH